MYALIDPEELATDVTSVVKDVVEEGSEGWLWRRRRGHDWM